MEKKKPFPIFRVGRIIIAIYLIQLLIIFIMWAHDRSTTALVWEQETLEETPVKLVFKRGTDIDKAFVPVYGVLDRLDWYLWVYVGNKKPGMIPIESPDVIPLKEFPTRKRDQFEDTDHYLKIFFGQEGYLLIEFLDGETAVEMITEP